MLPYPRMVVLHLSVLAAFVILLALPRLPLMQSFSVALLCGLIDHRRCMAPSA